MPKILILLEEVSNPATFRNVLWSYRHMVTRASDLYPEISNMRRMRAEVAVQSKA